MTRRMVFLVVALCASGWALGNSPFRVEGAYAPFDPTVAASGMVDLTRRVALRLRLAEFNFGSRRGFVVGLGEPGPNELNVLWSPWRDQWRVEPYCFGGAGLRCSNWERGDTSFSQVRFALPLGIGVEQLLFFWPEAPSFFIESRLLLYGDQTTLTLNPAPGQGLSPELKLEQQLRIGIRI